MTTPVIESEAFRTREAIPRKYTEDGQNISPPLRWTGIPPGTRELVLIVDDPDAPTAESWVHWVLYNIPPDISALPEGIPPVMRVPQPAGLLQGKNSWGRVGYGGPAPPRGHGLHHYRFRLYCLDRPLGLPPGESRNAVLSAMQGAVLAQAELVGTYQR